jgi:hypothetical protein
MQLKKVEVLKERYHRDLCMKGQVELAKNHRRSPLHLYLNLLVLSES